MSDKSPLFHSGTELLAHAIEHFAQNADRDKKLSVLHLANALELILKDKLLDLGESVYKNPKETKTIYAVFEDLEKLEVRIPQKHILELLIDERNTIQHRFGSISDVMAAYYVENVIDFFEQFLKAEYGIQLKDHLRELLSDDTLQVIYPEDAAPGSPLDVAREVVKVHPASGALTTWLLVERQLDALKAKVADKLDGRSAPPPQNLSPYTWLRQMLPTVPEIKDEWGKLFVQIRELNIVRNKITHGRMEIDSDVALEVIEKTEVVLKGIRELDKEVEKLPRAAVD